MHVSSKAGKIGEKISLEGDNHDMGALFLVVILAVSLVLVLVSDLWLELHITGPFQVDIRFGFCWHWFKHKLSVPLYRYRPGASLSPKEIVDSNSTKLISLIRFAQLIKIFYARYYPIVTYILGGMQLLVLAMRLKQDI